MRKSGFLTLVGCLALFLTLAPTSQADTEFEFSNIRTIKFEGVSGGLTIVPAEGEEGLVELRADIHPRRGLSR